MSEGAERKPGYPENRVKRSTVSFTSDEMDLIDQEAKRMKCRGRREVLMTAFRQATGTSLSRLPKDLRGLFFASEEALSGRLARLENTVNGLIDAVYSLADTGAGAGELMSLKTAKAPVWVRQDPARTPADMLEWSPSGKVAACASKTAAREPISEGRALPPAL